MRIKILWRTIGLFVCCAQLQAQRPPSRPNILFAIADDWGFGHAGAYGATWVKTPAFDRVARSGILFTRAYTPNAKCDDRRHARSSLMTLPPNWLSCLKRPAW
jgi:hypothetical protein